MGPSHSEVIITSNGPVLVEVGARLHGGMGPLIAETCSSVSLIDLSIDSYVDEASWVNTTAREAVLLKNGLEYFFINFKEGVLKDMPALDTIKSLNTYYMSEWSVKPGEFCPVTTNLLTSPGSAVLIDEKKESILQDRNILEKIEFESGLLRYH